MRAVKNHLAVPFGGRGKVNEDYAAQVRIGQAALGMRVKEGGGAIRV